VAWLRRAGLAPPGGASYIRRRPGQAPRGACCPGVASPAACGHGLDEGFPLKYHTLAPGSGLRRGVIAPALLLLPGLAIASAHMVSPKDGAIVAPRPNLVFKVDNYNDKMKFSVELSRDRFKEDSRIWDMRRTLRGWTIAMDEKEKGEGGEFLVPEDLGEGNWSWRVFVNDSGASSGPDFVGSFVVDASPPAEVDGLRVVKDPEAGGIRLTWDPVAIDVNGNAESVSSYRVYCYDKNGFFPQGNLKLLGTTDRQFYVDSNGFKARSSIAFYRITAVDEVGNESPPPKNPYYPEQPVRERKHRPEGAAPPPKDRPKTRQPLIPRPPADKKSGSDSAK